MSAKYSVLLSSMTCTLVFTARFESDHARGWVRVCERMGTMTAWAEKIRSQTENNKINQCECEWKMNMKNDEERGKWKEESGKRKEWDGNGVDAAYQILVVSQTTCTALRRQQASVPVTARCGVIRSFLLSATNYYYIYYIIGT